jgi:hypothetical protein
MKTHGVNASWTIFGGYFKNTKFMLWHANDAVRTNLLGGIAAPDSGHYWKMILVYKFNRGISFGGKHATNLYKPLLFGCT